MGEGRNLVGVDIGSSSIKVCEIKEARSGARSLVRFGYYPLPPQTIVDGHVMNAGAVVAGLEQLFHKAKRRDIALRLSGHSVIIKKINIPLMTAEELAQQINWEAEQYIPFDIADVQLDYQVLQERPDAGQMEVLLVAAKREEIGDLTNLAFEARLRPRVVDLDAFTVQNCFEAAYGGFPAGQTIALLHMGASIATLNMISNGVTAFTRDITSGGNGITAEVQRRLGVSFEEADALKCGTSAEEAPPEIAEIVREGAGAFAGEIQRSLDFYIATSGDRSIDKIYVSGGTANVRSLLDAISTGARVAVELLDPLQLAIPDAKTVDLAELRLRALQMSVACGLALRKDHEQ
ncbi:MAG: type IV pilus assembly protein PilM [Myxococcales bacterium]|nr:type IV pilus assembly protein PilM [Myxococcales bacterium]MCB9708739.1 type IV pilus assembly protein PilM [Myxococcales bacterium]